ncbi:hypothetical protein B0T26DRAFT_795561 [Lasiosphaeria miniovina]|uniref:Uncharacterized protein n=1 Tax=Lasiosphaeria miniovina TaxID=1954250 RepID=A0AA39ZQJ3_9PEZI|nr:uncharacterized protein B0T26DRAFT_795561 [Lasiosphaeria miniovina]KAK0701849.1 hypothetical protein B0T26DRAFT_795561 [Lasiosphaeria miniovina]
MLKVLEDLPDWTGSTSSNITYPIYVLVLAPTLDDGAEDQDTVRRPAQPLATTLAMCTGYSVQVVCGHTLMHFATRCLKNCAAPEGPVSFIHDTCAKCHPEFVMKNIRERYYTERERIMARYRHAVSYNLGDEAERLTQVLEDLEDTCRKNIAAAKFFSIGLQPDEVIFPGNPEQE